jgi:Ca2+-dependent lipid-binding protein
LAITVHSASKIQSGGDTIHPFVRFFLNEQQELEKTSVCENTNTPLWNETRFILLNSLDPILSLQLRSSNNTKKSGKKLATATFALKDLQKLDEYAIENK